MRLASLAAAAFLWAAAAQGETGTVLETIAIRDTGGFAPGITALTVRAPRDWESSGGVVWTSNPHCVRMPVSVAFTTRRQDGLAGFDILPGAMSAWASDPAINGQYEQAASDGAMGCLHPTQSFRVQGYLDTVFLGTYRREHEDMRILSARRLAAIADQIEARTAREIGSAAFDHLRNIGGSAEIYGDAGLFDITYTMAGQAIRERVFVSLAVNEITLPRPGGTSVTLTSSFTDKVVSWFAPENEFESLAPLFDFMIASTAYNGQWVDRVAQSISRLAARDSDMAALHTSNASATGFVSEQIHGVAAGSPMLIDSARRLRVVGAQERRAMAAADGADAAFYVNAQDDVLLTRDGAVVDTVRWTLLQRE